ncbi:MAG: zinc-ribbon domain-containing protein [Clostridiales bacterium]|nr:zinc-ribbon domain-containing protein [Clostridiales bacterium]
MVNNMKKERMNIMEFFDKLSKKASEAYKITADKTGKLAKETKLKLKISELKSEINTIYTEIGKKAYEKHTLKNGKENCTENVCEEIKEKCLKIDMLSDEIDNLLKQCLELKDKKQCENCYAEIEKDVKFCPHCGAKQEEIAVEAEVLEATENSNSDDDDNAFGAEQEPENKDNSDDIEEQKDKTNLEKTVEVESNVETQIDSTEIEEAKKEVKEDGEQ